MACVQRHCQAAPGTLRARFADLSDDRGPTQYTTADTALKPARLFKMPPRFWMRLQADRDLHEALAREARKAS